MDEIINQIRALDFDALMAIKKETEKVIEERKEELVRQFRQEVFELAKKYGIPAKEIGAIITGKRNRRKLAPRYRYPTDPTKAWSGRGLAPKWIKEWEAAGRSREELLIDNGPLQ